ncbi:acyltransferase family protein [Cohnella rhizosphaerae]|uniref:Acyltransferase family protein n=1 Tax=Cohnella rhizosphaerae TaxID=1457232 RepID=A0A9X4KX90_9BACL|nr:acyltransferase family protein [Cohnella rhizosphaerae]MDG0812552.1 acyltransferase family protein [Cohnella rhizosphaerae]
MHTTKAEPSRYMPGLDGLRAIAVIAVIAYHLDFDWASGGLLGVGVFFVLSGYLITDQIASELHREGRLNLKRFWVRRARRLLPAMLLVMAAVSLYLLLFDRDRLPSLAGDVWSAVTYTSNWYLIYHHVSYFESFGPPSPFGHLWSLAVEEQFYLLWPLLLPAAAALFGRRGKTALAIAATAAASAVLMAALYVPGADPSRIYYGTDTRAFGLLIGAALALVWPSGRLSAGLPGRYRVGLDGAGIAALAGILLMIRYTSEYDSFLYRGGLVVLSLLAAALVAALAHPDSRLGAWLGCGPMRWIGKRSYGIYLWHYPVIALSEKQVNADGPEPLRIALQLAVSVALAALSYRFVENPIRRRGLAAVKDGLLAAAASFGSGIRSGRPSAPSRPAACLSVAALILLCVSCTGGAQPLSEGAKAVASDGTGVIAGSGPDADDASGGPAAGGGNGGADVRPVKGPVGTSKPTPKPTSDPTSKPTSEPTTKPTSGPTATPTSKPASEPTPKPSPGANPPAQHAQSPSPTPSGSPAPQQSAGGGRVREAKVLRSRAAEQALPSSAIRSC